MANTKTKKPDQKEYERLGRLLVALGETSHRNRRELYKVSLIKGMVTGFGGVLGATIVLAVVLYVLSLLGEIPFIGSVAESVEQTLDQN